MELTPQLLETQQFPEKFRGYDCDAVDDFLERVGVGVADLHEQLAQARARIAELEGGAAAAAPAPAPAPAPEPVVAPAPAPAPAAGGADMDQISRALLMAQKAADQAVEDAHAEGRKIVAAAEVEARAVVQRAQTEGAEMRTKTLAEAEEAARAIKKEADQALVQARNSRADAEAERDRVRIEAMEQAQVEADRLIEDAKVAAGKLVDEARVKATQDLERRQRELRSELTDLEQTVVSRRYDARLLTELVSGRRETIATVARELEALGERLEDVSGDGRARGAAATIDLDEATETPAEPITSAPSWSSDSRASTAHPAGSEASPSVPRWATIDGADAEPEAEQRPDLHVVEADEAAAAVEAGQPEAPVAPEPQPAPEAVAPAPAPPAPAAEEPPAAPAPVVEAAPAPEVREAEPQVSAPAPPPMPAPPQPAPAPAQAAPPSPMEQALSEAKADNISESNGSSVDAVDDPFLAALRGREPLRGDEPEDDGARRRRRRRR